MGIHKAPFRGNPFHSSVANKATVTVGAENTGAGTINVAIQLQDGNEDLAESVCVFAYLSDNADGSSIVATAPDGGWAIGTDGLLIPVVANKAAFLVSESDGEIDVTITESGAKTLYLVLVLNGELTITEIEFAA